MTGGLAGVSDATRVCSVLIFLVVWLTTIYLLRHKMAGHKVCLRDGLYNAMAPLISTFVVLAVAIVECVPIFLLVVAYAAAVQTDFLAMPFYALLFMGFAALMVTISGYLLSSTLVALVAVTAPGLYPLKALKAATDVMLGRRMSFVARLLALGVTLAIVWVVVMLVSHYGASWVYGNKPMPLQPSELCWPLDAEGQHYNRQWLLDMQERS